MVGFRYAFLHIFLQLQAQKVFGERLLVKLMGNPAPFLQMALKGLLQGQGNCIMKLLG